MSIHSARIKSLIEQSGLSYLELEKATGIKKSSLQRYASGVTSKIPLEVIEKLANAFHVSQLYLMGWEENSNRPMPTPAPKEIPNRNIIRIAGRNGSYEERVLSDEQLSALKAIIDQMPDASDDL